MTADIAASTVQHTRDSPLLTFYAWERWGNFINAQPGDGTEIPYDAAKIQVKVYPFAAGEIRVLRFFPKVRTHDHVNKTDTILYEWTARRVQFVNDDAAICDPGSFALHPKGVFHHGEVLTAGLAVEFAMPATAAANPAPTFVAAGQVPTLAAAAWSADGGWVEAIGEAADKAPDDAARFAVRSVDFGRYVTREVRIPAGTVIGAGRDDVDVLMVVLAGALRLDTGGVSHDLGVEDTAQVRRGRAFTRTAIEDAVVLEALVPPVAGA